MTGRPFAKRVPVVHTPSDTDTDTDTYDGLSRRLAALEDKEALRALMIRGWRALDRKDWEAWSGCWAEDAVLEFAPWGTVHGRAAIRAKVEAAEAAYPTMQHHILNTHFEVAGDRATGIGYMWFVTDPVPGSTASPYSVGGPYDWDFRREGRRWVLVRQTVGVWWSEGEDPAGSAFGRRAEGGSARQEGQTPR